MSPATSAITIKVGDHASKDTQLEHATSLLREKATRCGILVTMVNFTTSQHSQSPLALIYRSASPERLAVHVRRRGQKPTPADMLPGSHLSRVVRGATASWHPT